MFSARLCRGCTSCLPLGPARSLRMQRDIHLHPVASSDAMSARFSSHAGGPQAESVRRRRVRRHGSPETTDRNETEGPKRPRPGRTRVAKQAHFPSTPLPSAARTGPAPPRRPSPIASGEPRAARDPVPANLAVMRALGARGAACPGPYQTRIGGARFRRFSFPRPPGPLRVVHKRGRASTRAPPLPPPALWRARGPEFRRPPQTGQ